MQRLHNGWDVLWLAVSSAELALVVPPKCIYPTHFHQHGRVGGAEGHVNNTMFPQFLERCRYKHLRDLQLSFVEDAALHLHDERLTLV